MNHCSLIVLWAPIFLVICFKWLWHSSPFLDEIIWAILILITARKETLLFPLRKFYSKGFTGDQQSKEKLIINYCVIYNSVFLLFYHEIYNWLKVTFLLWNLSKSQSEGGKKLMPTSRSKILYGQLEVNGQLPFKPLLPNLKPTLKFSSRK